MAGKVCAKVCTIKAATRFGDRFENDASVGSDGISRQRLITQTEATVRDR